MSRLNLLFKGLVVLGIWFVAGACGFSLFAQTKQPPSKAPAPPPNPNQPSSKGLGRFTVPAVTTVPTWINGYGPSGGGFTPPAFFHSAGNPSSFYPGSFVGYPNILSPGMQPGSLPPGFYQNTKLNSFNIPWQAYNFTNPIVPGPSFNPMMNPMMMNPNMMNPFVMNPYMVNPMLMNIGSFTNPYANQFMPMVPNPMNNMPMMFGVNGGAGMGFGNAPVVGAGFAGNLPVGGVPFNPALGFRP